MKKENGVLLEVDEKEVSYSLLKNNELWQDVVEIGKYAFMGINSFQHVEIPKGVKNIGNMAFRGCENLEYVNISGSVEKIGWSSFRDCKNLGYVQIEQGVKVIEEGAFAECQNLQQIRIPGSVSQIGEESFYKCSKLSKVDIEEGVKTIENKAFAGCKNLSFIKLPNSLNYIGKNAFADTSIKNVTIAHGGMQYSVPVGLLNVVSLENVRDHMLKPGMNFGLLSEMYKNANINLTDEMSMVNMCKLCTEAGVFSHDKKHQTKATQIIKDLFMKNKRNPNPLDVNTDLSKILHNGENAQWNSEFLKFLELNIKDVKENVNLIPKISEWYKLREELSIDSANLNASTPKNEDQRFKMLVNTQGEGGVIRQNWKKPTFENFKEFFKENKYIGIESDRDKEIAEELMTQDEYKDQKFYNKAKELDQERENLVKSGKIQNSLISDVNFYEEVAEIVKDSPLSEEEQQAFVNAYNQETDNAEKQIEQNLGKALENQEEVAKLAFKFDLLSKDSVKMFTIGQHTSCCAKLYGPGAGAMRATIIDPNMQALTIKNENDEIVAFSILYINKEEGYMVCNDLEVNEGYSQDEDSLIKIAEQFELGAIAVAKKYNKENPDAKPIKQINTGLSPNPSAGNLNNLIKDACQKTEKDSEDWLQAVDFNDYTYLDAGKWPGDWHNDQYILWKDDQNTQEGENVNGREI